MTLPSGWTETTLGAIRSDLSRRATPSAYPEQMFELWSVPAFGSGRPEVVKGAAVGSEKQTVVPGTVLLCKINPRINRVWVVGPPQGHEQIASTEWIPFFPVVGLDPSYLKYYLLQEEFRTYAASNVSGVGGSLMRVRLQVIDRYPIRLAPYLEQRRIVAVIDENFSRLDAATTGIERSRKLLQQYRASVLTHAVTGRLVETEAAVARRNGSSIETGQALLARFGVEAFDPPVTDLPDGWAFARLRDVAELKGGLTKGQHRRGYSKLLTVPYLRVANVQRGFLDLGQVSQIEATEAEIEDLRLRSGDVLFNEGGDRDKLGRGWIWQDELPVCIHQNHVFRARPRGGLIDSRFLSWYGNSVARGVFSGGGKTDDQPRVSQPDKAWGVTRTYSAVQRAAANCRSSRVSSISRGHRNAKPGISIASRDKHSPCNSERGL